VSAPSVGPYELLGELGRGGAGRVYRARHVPTGAIRAVKVLESVPDLETLDRFRREAQSLARLSGAGVVPVHETGVSGNRLFLAMDLMSGGSLRAVLAARGRLPWVEAASIVAKLARTLDRCHELGLIHRDVKPDNVLLDDSGEPRLADFGCVRDLAAASLTVSGTTIGTTLYMAPEQLEGRAVGPPADIFALGAVLYELVTGAHPHTGRTAHEVAINIARGNRTPASHAAGSPPALDRVIARALAPVPASRYASGGDLATALEALLTSERPEAAPRARRRSLLAAALVGGAALAGGSFFFFQGRSGTDAYRVVSVARARERLLEAADLPEEEVAALASFTATVAGSERDALDRAFAAGMKKRWVAAERTGDSARALAALERAGRLDPTTAQTHAILLALSGDLEGALAAAPDADARNAIRARTALARGDASLARSVLADPGAGEPAARALASELARFLGRTSRRLETKTPWDDVDLARTAITRGRPWEAGRVETRAQKEMAGAELALALEKARLALARLDPASAAADLAIAFGLPRSGEAIFVQAEALALAADVAAADGAAATRSFPASLVTPEQILAHASRLALVWPPVVRAHERQHDRELAAAGSAPSGKPLAASVAAERSLSFSGELGLPGLVVAAALETVVCADRAGSVEAATTALAAAVLARALAPQSALAAVLEVRAALQAHDLRRAEGASSWASRLLPGDPETALAAARVALARVEVGLDARLESAIAGKPAPVEDLAPLADGAVKAAERAVSTARGASRALETAASLALGRAHAARILSRPPPVDPREALAPVRAALAPLLEGVPIAELAAASRDLTAALSRLDGQAIEAATARVDELVVLTNRTDAERTLTVLDAMSVLGEAEGAAEPGARGDAEEAFLLLDLDGAARAKRWTDRKEVRTHAQANAVVKGHLLSNDEAEMVIRLAPDMSLTLWDAARRRREDPAGDWTPITVTSTDVIIDILRDVARAPSDQNSSVRNAVYVPADLRAILDVAPRDLPEETIAAIARRASSSPGEPSLLVLRSGFARGAFGEADLDRAALACPDSWQVHVLAADAEERTRDFRLRHAIEAFRVGYAPLPAEHWETLSDDPSWRELCLALAFPGEETENKTALARAAMQAGLARAKALAAAARSSPTRGLPFARLVLSLVLALQEPPEARVAACRAVLELSPGDAVARTALDSVERSSPRDCARTNLDLEASRHPLADDGAVRRARSETTSPGRVSHRALADTHSMQLTPSRELDRVARTDPALRSELARRPWLGVARHATLRPVTLARHHEALVSAIDRPEPVVDIFLREVLRARSLGATAVANNVRGSLEGFTPDVRLAALEPVRRSLRLLALLVDLWDDVRDAGATTAAQAYTLDLLHELDVPLEARGPLVRSFAVTGDAEGVRALLRPFKRRKAELTDPERAALAAILADPALVALAARDRDLAELVGAVK
jgi:hypothetical protein